MDYFGAKNRAEIGKSLNTKVSEFYDALSSSHYSTMLRKSFRTYFGVSDDGIFSAHTLSDAGDFGELTSVKVNHYRNLSQHVLNLVTQTRPAWQARANFTDSTSIIQTELANAILETYMRDKQAEVELKKATEFAIVLGSAWMSVTWDDSLGHDYASDPLGNKVTVGDVQIKAFQPLNVVINLNRSCYEQDWVIVKEVKNKFNVASAYPQIKDKILAIQRPDKKNSTDLQLSSQFRKVENDDIYYYTFYHKPCPILPNGRLVTFLDQGIVLEDQALPYREIPIYPMTPSEIFDSGFSYSNAFDLLAISEAFDIIMSEILTNQINTGICNIAIPAGHNMIARNIGGGMKVLEYNDGKKPETMNFLNTPRELFDMLKFMEGYMQKFLGITSVQRGEPDASLKSGTALAMVASQAVQFNSSIQECYNRVLEKTGTAVIERLQQFATVPRIEALVGEHNRSYAKTFTAKDLNAVCKVTVERVSAVSKTSSGRIEMANNLLNSGLLRTPEEYLQVIKTGNLDPLIQGQTSELLYIKEENEALRRGEVVEAIITDDHSVHVKEHKAVLCSLDARKNPAILNAALSHINQHIMLASTADPNMMILLGQQPLAPPQPPMRQAGGQPQSPSEILATPDSGAAPDGIKAPQNPMTGLPYNNETGGLQ